MASTKTTLIILLLALASCKTPQPPTVTVLGLWPEEPPLSYKPYIGWFGRKNYIWPVLDAQPILRWESFPRPGDAAADISGVRYDLRIWRNEGGFPGALVCVREGLPEPRHRIEQPLRRGEYFWTIRAHFQLHGQTRVTDWSRIELPLPFLVPTQTWAINYPDARYYRFRIR